MNNMNSCIIEGNISKINKDGFDITTRRYFKVGEKTKEEKIEFSILTKKSSDIAIEHCKINRGVRVVGRLSKKGFKTVVFAEYVEFKPFFKKQEDF